MPQLRTRKALGLPPVVQRTSKALGLLLVPVAHQSTILGLAPVRPMAMAVVQNFILLMPNSAFLTRPMSRGT